jgi:hypothetical protein
MRLRRMARPFAVAALALALAPSAANADFTSFSGTGTGSDGALSATADVTTSNGQVTVTLTNTLAADVIRSAGQALSDFSFTLSNAPGTLGTTSATGQLGDVSSTGVVTYVAGDPTRWLGAGGQGGFSIVGNTITLETIGGGQPTQMIAPFVANGGSLSNVNQGFQNFNPYVIGPATFTLALSGVTAGTTVTGATFSFGTGPDTFIPGVQVPEPASWAMMAIGLVALGVVRRMRRRAS